MVSRRINPTTKGHTLANVFATKFTASMCAKHRKTPQDCFQIVMTEVHFGRFCTRNLLAGRAAHLSPFVQLFIRLQRFGKILQDPPNAASDLTDPRTVELQTGCLQTGCDGGR